jgi:hypothetical protein
VNLSKIVDEILANPSGGTIRLTGGELPTSGYYVGNGRRGLVCPAGMVSRSIVLGAVIHLHIDARFIGWWTDGDRFYVEPSDWTANYNHAVQMAAERGELAFFDVARQADIRMDQPAA